MTMDTSKATLTKKKLFNLHESVDWETVLLTEKLLGRIGRKDRENHSTQTERGCACRHRR